MKPWRDKTSFRVEAGGSILLLVVRENRERIASCSWGNRIVWAACFGQDTAGDEARCSLRIYQEGVGARHANEY